MARMAESPAPSLFVGAMLNHYIQGMGLCIPEKKPFYCHFVMNGPPTFTA
jgi:hypothetical protein